MKNNGSYAALGRIPPWGCGLPLGLSSELPITYQKNISSKQTIKVKVPFDLMITGIHGLAVDSGGTPTLAYKANLKLGALRDWVYHTVPVRGVGVPAALVIGNSFQPYEFPVPFFARKGDTIQLLIEPDEGVTLSFTSVTLVARELRGPEAQEFLRFHPQVTGYQALVGPALTVNEASGVSGTQYGPEVHDSGGIDAQNYDLLLEEKSVLITASEASSVPLAGFIVGTRESYSARNEEFQQGLVPSTRYGGTDHDAFDPLTWRPVSSKLPAAILLDQETNLTYRAAFLLGSSSSCVVRTAFHGQRIPSKGAPMCLGTDGANWPGSPLDPRQIPT